MGRYAFATAQYLAKRLQSAVCAGNACIFQIWSCNEVHEMHVSPYTCGWEPSERTLELEHNGVGFCTYVGEASPFETNKIRSVLAWILRRADARK